MCCCVAELVGVQVSDAGLVGTSLQHRGDAVVADGATGAEPPLRLVRLRASVPDALVAIERLGRLRPERDDAVSGALADDEHHLGLEVDVLHADADHLPQPHARVDEQPDDGVIAAAHPVLAAGGVQQGAQLLVRQHGHGAFVGGLRRLHLRHRRHRDLVLLDEPAEPLLQTAEPEYHRAHRGAGRRAVVKLLNDPLPHVRRRLARKGDRVIVGRAPGRELTDGRQVVLDRPVRLAVGAQ